MNSILKQEVLPDEIIVVDDCSTDNSLEIIEAEIAKYPQVKLLKNKRNLGTYGAINAGLEYASSEYVMFLSANDFVLPGIFKHAKLCLSSYPGVGLWSAMGWLVNEESGPIKPLQIAVPALKDQYFSPQKCIALANRLGNWFTGPSVVYHKKTFESVGRFDAQYKGLADLVCALMVASKRGAVFSPFPYVAFRQHNGSYLSSTFRNPKEFGQLLKRLTTNCSQMAPELFNEAFAARTKNRYIFSAIHQSKGIQLNSYQDITHKLAGKILSISCELIPSRFSIARIAIAFIALRPYDIWPSLWNRLLGTSLAFKKAGRVFKKP